jgi:hypothetical protein
MCSALIPAGASRTSNKQQYSAMRGRQGAGLLTNTIAIFGPLQAMLERRLGAAAGLLFP